MDFLQNGEITYNKGICLCFGPSREGRTFLIKKKWADNRMRKFYSEMWGNMAWGSCENFEGMYKCDGPVEIVECIWVII